MPCRQIGNTILCGPKLYRYKGWFFEWHSYCGPWPLKDDVHTFGKERPELTFKDEANWQEVTAQSILEFIGKDRVLKSYLVKDVFIIHLSGE